MAIIRFKSTHEEGNIFVEKLRNGEIHKEVLLNHGKVFAREDEKLALLQFYNFLNSMSYVMLLDRKNQLFNYSKDRPCGKI